MSAAVHHYAARITWARGDQPFTDKRYSRCHAWHFDGGAVVAGSSSPLSVPLPMFAFTGCQFVGSVTGSPAEMAEMMALVRAGKVAPVPVSAPVSVIPMVTSGSSIFCVKS